MSARIETTNEGTTLFTWIHVSDIHHGDLSLLLEELKRDIKSGVSKQDVPSPDVILVTGNVTEMASQKEYAEVRDWLLELKNNLKANIFVVPGERDVDPDLEKDRSIWRLIRDLREPQLESDTIDAALANQQEQQLLAQRLTRYVNFSKVVMPDEVKYANSDLVWHHRLWAGGGLRVKIVGLNTSLLCTKMEGGKHSLGRKQIRDTLLASPRNCSELVLVLSHYPLGEGKLEDGQEAQSWIRRYTHVQISGDRETDSAFLSGTTGGGQRFLQFRAGLRTECLKQLSRSTAENDRIKNPRADPRGQQQSPDYLYWFVSVIRREDGTLALRAWPRRWSNKNKDFRRGEDGLEDGRTCFEHDLHGEWPCVSKPCMVEFRFQRSARYENVTYRAVRTHSPPNEESNNSDATFYLVFYRIEERERKELERDELVRVEARTTLKLIESWSYKRGDVPNKIYKQLLADLAKAPHGESQVKRKSRQVVVNKREYRFEATLAFGAIKIKRDNVEVADATWHKGTIVDTSASLDPDEKVSQEIYRRIEANLNELYDG